MKMEKRGKRERNNGRAEKSLHSNHASPIREGVPHCLRSALPCSVSVLQALRQCFVLGFLFFLLIFGMVCLYLLQHMSECVWSVCRSRRSIEEIYEVDHPKTAGLRPLLKIFRDNAFVFMFSHLQ